MSDADLVKLYSGQILQLAGSIPHLGRLAQPCGSAKLRSPVCGSTIGVDVVVADGRITDFAQEVRACALGQAAASVLGRVVIGCNRAELAQARNEVTALLTANGPAPLPPFGGFEVLRAAKDYKNRHASILLALNATIAAMDAST